MEDIDDGGPAFARPCGTNDDGWNESQPGISMRDYFAAAALTGALFNQNAFDDPKLAAQWSYEFADAMIKARKGGK